MAEKHFILSFIYMYMNIIVNCVHDVYNIFPSPLFFLSIIIILYLIIVVNLILSKVKVFDHILNT